MKRRKGTKAEQQIIVQLRLAPETVIPKNYHEWCKATTRGKGLYEYDKRCHLRDGHTGPHMSGDGIDWDTINLTVIPKMPDNIIFWNNQVNRVTRDKTKESN